MTYTIEQINKAWIAFNKPTLIVVDTDPSSPDRSLGIERSTEVRYVQKQDFISFLIALYDDKAGEDIRLIDDTPEEIEVPFGMPTVHTGSWMDWAKEITAAVNKLNRERIE